MALYCPYCSAPFPRCSCRSDRRLSYSLVLCLPEHIRRLIEVHHPYQSAGGRVATYCFAAVEGPAHRAVAGYIWRPPPPGAAKRLAPKMPQSVLALSRMAALPHHQRRLNHVSKPLRAQLSLIDRGRWPVLVTYSDASCGHTGHVYKCSGWTKGNERLAKIYEDEQGRRVSPYSNGRMKGIKPVGETILTEWTHRVCLLGEEQEHMESAGWKRVPIPGKFWRSGNQAHKFVKE